MISGLNTHVTVSHDCSWSLRFSNPIPCETFKEEQMSLSAKIKNHYFDSFTNSFVSSAVEDGWHDAVELPVCSLIFTGRSRGRYVQTVTYKLC